MNLFKEHDIITAFLLGMFGFLTRPLCVMSLGQVLMEHSVSETEKKDYSTK